MNIFILDRNPKLAARANCDKHVIKIILEISQMLSMAMSMSGSDKAPYRVTHQNHPMSKFVRTTKGNYKWTCDHLEALLQEYTERYGKIHKCAQYLNLFRNSIHLIPDGDLTTFPQCMPDEYRDEDPVKAYKTYYKMDKARFAKWRLGNEPDWWH